MSNGLAYVCGMDIEGYGTLSVIDLSTMSVKKSIRADKGESKSTPLVSVQGNDTYVYFTCNALPGGVYAYKLGDDAAQMIFTPDAKYREYCTASIICDEKGNLYYANVYGVYRCKPDGSNLTQLSDIRSSTLNIADGYIYHCFYADTNSTYDQSLYRMKLDGSKEEKLTSDSGSYITCLDGFIYFRNVYKGQDIYRINAENTIFENVLKLYGAN